MSFTAVFKPCLLDPYHTNTFVIAGMRLKNER